MVVIAVADYYSSLIAGSGIDEIRCIMIVWIELD
jgi:hypothetical protein